MPRVIYVEAGGGRHEVEAAAGTSVMQAAISAGVPGIVAECGGAAMCATCHVYVEPLPGLPAIGPVEEEMLDSAAAERRPTSRLSCQIKLKADLDGLVVHLPERQY